MYGCVSSDSRAIIAIWQERWDARGATLEMGEVTKTVSHLWDYTNVRERRLQTALARLRIGHTRLTHSYLMSGEYQPYCDDCLVPLYILPTRLYSVYCSYEYLII